MTLWSRLHRGLLGTVLVLLVAGEGERGYVAGAEVNPAVAAAGATARVPAGVRLDLRCTPHALSAAQIRDALRDLATAGPDAARQRGDPYQWFETLTSESATEATPEIADRLGGHSGYWIARHAGKPFMLLSTKPAEAMLWQDGWSLASLWQQRTPEDRRIVWRFDERGSTRFAALTERSINAPLAILLDNRVAGVPRVREKITGGQAEIVLRPAVETAFAEFLRALPEADPNAPPEPTFGPVHELVLTAAAGAQDLLDLDSGKVTRLDVSAMPVLGRANSSSATPDNHLDLGAITDPAVHGLIGWDLIAIPTPAASWDGLPAASLVGMRKDFLASCRAGSLSFLTAKGSLPETFIVRTREGGLGLLQILAFTNDPEGLRIRYKLAP